MATYTFEKLRPDYDKLWAKMSITRSTAAEAEAKEVIKHRNKYAGIQTDTGVPWFIVGALHIREAGSPPDFKAVLHNGERIVNTNRKTKLVPAGRGPFKDPDGFRKAAHDALINVEGLGGIKWDEKTGIARCAWLMEKFNGFGYRKHNIPSPYLWGGTNVQERGKYVSDGVYDANTMDTQIGGMAILKCIMRLDETARFTAPTPVVVPIKVPKEVPRAVKTGAAIAAPFIAFAAFFQDNAWWIIPLGVLIFVTAAIAVNKRGHKPLSPKAEEVPNA